MSKQIELDYKANSTENSILHKEIEKSLPFSNKVDSRTFSRLLDKNIVVSSYKMYWLLGILDEVSAGKEEIEFKRIIFRMISYAWYPIVRYKLNFGSFDNLKNPINYILLKEGYSPNIDEKELLDFLCKNQEDKELKKMINDLTLKVPYRLLSPFFSNELYRVKDSLRNRLIMELSQKSNTCLYKIVKEKEYKIIINSNWTEYLQENYKLIKCWIYYKLVCFLQKRNPNVPAIAFKLEAPKTRNLTNASKLWNQIIIDKNIMDIYTGKEFNEINYHSLGVLSIDHFIPWSFVLHDEMWNLVPTFKNINSSKSDKLLLFDNYIDSFCDVQYKAFGYLCEKRLKNSLEEYINVLRIETPYQYYKSTNAQDFKTKIKQCISPIYQIAVNQGFEVMEKINF